MYEQLKNVDEIYLPKTKEIHFFDNDENYAKGRRWYASFFSGQSKKVKGEITPAYLFFENVPQRIYKTLGRHVKFIVLLRNPVDRAYSQYNMSFYTQKVETMSFLQALISEPHRIHTYNDKINFTYASRGFYSEQIQRYLELFDRSRFKFILYEDFVVKQQMYVNEILEFLNIDKKVEIVNKTVFKNEYQPMNRDIREMLNGVYREEVARLAQMVDLDFDIWGIA